MTDICEMNRMRLCKTCKVEKVDHDHKTGKIRGLLCNTCNQGLGYFKDNISTLEDAMFYLILYK